MIPPSLNNWIHDHQGQPNFPQLPPNIADRLSPEMAQKIWLYISRNYVWPQCQERMSFEPLWDRLHRLSRAKLETGELQLPHSSQVERRREESENPAKNTARVSDSVIHDAIERLTDITHFVSFKEDFPVQYNIPPYFNSDKFSSTYNPIADKIKGANAVLQWNGSNEAIYTKYIKGARHFYTYGIAFAHSDFVFQVKHIGRRDSMGQIVPRLEVTKIGTTFDFINLRKIWLNWRIPVERMNDQPCPFFFTETPRFATLQNKYDPQMNPTGFLNLDKLTRGEYIYTGPEFQSALNGYLTEYGKGGTAQILKPEHSVEALWTLYPVLPFDPESGEFDEDGSKGIIPKRFIVNTFGKSLHSGDQIFLRLQESYFPKDQLPIYGSCHLADMDSGLYTPAIGDILYNHYVEMVTCMEQYLANKDWINDPPSWVQVSSPAAEQDLNQPGVKIKVNGPNDFGWRAPYDATGTTANIMTYLREGAQTTSKMVDAVLGKAMGGRTSATEAQNAFEAAMSGITTPVNIFNRDIFGGFASRMWDYTGKWFDKDLLKAITGDFGFILTPEDMWLNIGIKYDTGSTYVENIVKQQNIRYILEAGRMDPSIKRDKFWRMLLDLMKFPSEGLIDDGGEAREIRIATEQAIKTYQGIPVIVSPDQNHNLAMQVKTQFLEDVDSYWNKTFPEGALGLLPQLKVHQEFAMLQMQQELLMMQMQGDMNAAGAEAKAQSQTSSSSEPARSPGQSRQQTGE